VAETKRKESTIDSIRSAVQAVKHKKMDFLKDLLGPVLHSISS
jgi:hypothetical protein